MKKSIKEKIIIESERILFASDEKLTYRTLSSNLGISIGVINYHYPKQEDLFLAIYKLKIEGFQTLNFTSLLDNIFDEFSKISRKNNEEFINALFNLIPQKIWQEYYPLIEMKFKTEFGVVNKECIVAIVTQVQMLLICNEQISTYLGLNNNTEMKLYIKKVINNELIQHGINIG